MWIISRLITYIDQLNAGYVTLDYWYSKKILDLDFHTNVLPSVMTFDCPKNPAKNFCPDCPAQKKKEFAPLSSFLYG